MANAVNWESAKGIRYNNDNEVNRESEKEYMKSSWQMHYIERVRKSTSNLYGKWVNKEIAIERKETIIANALKKRECETA